MVARILIFFLLIGIPLFAVSSSEVITPESLSKMSGVSNRQHKERSERVKASELRTMLRKFNPDNDDVLFKRLDGRFIPGYLLPNGVVVPALFELGRKQPGCMAQNGTIYHAEWKNKQLTCFFPQDRFYAVHKTADENSESVAPSGDTGTTSIGGNQSQSESIGSGGEVQTKNKLSKYQSNSNDLAGKPSAGVSRVDAQGSKNETRPQANIQKTQPAYLYVAQSFAAQQDYSGADQVVIKKKRFGLPINTWIEAELRRQVSSVDNGDIELIVTEEIIGKYQSIPEGASLFATKRFNSSTKRMELSVRRGVTPTGEEFSIRASGFDSNEQSGLAGSVIRNREREFGQAADETLLAAGADVLGYVGGDGIAGNSVNRLSGKMLSNEARNIEKAPRSYIQVSPQIVLLRLNESI